MEAKEKKELLIRRLKELDSLLVAFSSGVDSTFLLALAQEVLGEKVLAVTANSIIYSQRELKEALAFAKERGIEHVVLSSDALNLPGFSMNPPDRCYRCKKHLFLKLRHLADERGMKHVAHAANLDDLKDYRPGWKAAEEMGVIAPLVDAKLTKEEIRFLSREMDLPTWNKPSMACFASRIPFGEAITENKLKMIEEAEGFLASLGFAQVRVRHHGSLARIEVESRDIHRLADQELRKEVLRRLKDVGFLHVSLDLEGYVMGSMNRELEMPRVSEVPKAEKQKTVERSQQEQ